MLGVCLADLFAWSSRLEANSSGPGAVSTHPCVSVPGVGRRAGGRDAPSRATEGLERVAGRHAAKRAEAHADLETTTGRASRQARLMAVAIASTMQASPTPSPEDLGSS